jgi:hypothetical protein
MAYSINLKEMISYPPEQLKTFRLTMYEWIDNLNFTMDPAKCLDNADEYIAVAKALFLEAGWAGDGEIELIWIPPFMFRGTRIPEFTVGVIIWHVKQDNDGLSWILTPVELPCETEFDQKDALVVTINVGVAPNIINNTMAVYRYAKDNQLMINTGYYSVMTDYSLKIDNPLGLAIFKNAVNRQLFYISTSTWEAGVYFLQILDPSNAIVAIREIVVQ